MRRVSQIVKPGSTVIVLVIALTLFVWPTVPAKTGITSPERVSVLTSPKLETQRSQAESKSASLPARPSTEGLTVRELTTENLPNPLGLEAAKPRLSWQLDTLARDKTQSAYQVQAASLAVLLTSEKPDIWDSGQTSGNDQVLVPYGGPALKSASTYYWRVRVWDENGIASDWSSISSWTTGILNQSEWHADWINPAGSVRVGGSYFRKEFSLPQSPTSALVFVSGRGVYERGPDGQGFCCQQAFTLARGIYNLSLNGSPVGDAMLESQPVDSRIRSLYRTWDVSTQLRAGSNTLGVMTGEDSDVLIQLFLSFPDGTTTVVASDGSWQSRPGPVTRAHRFHGETFDARVQIQGWDSANASNDGWSGVDVVPDRGKLSPAVNEPSKIIRSIKPLTVTEPATAIYVLDFGQNISGRTVLSVKIPRGATITVKHGERLANGRVDNTILGAEQTSTFVGDGTTSQFEAKFTYAGFRWAEISGLTTLSSSDALVAQEIRSAVPDAGTFSSAADLLNKLHAADRQTEANGLHGIPVDTPTREKRGWMGDAHLAAEATMNNFGMSSFYTKFIQDMEDAQQPSGLVPDVVPVEAAGDWQSRSDPAWGVATVLIPYYMWRTYGDVSVLRNHYDSMNAWMSQTASTTDGYLITRPSATWGNDWLALEPTDSRLFRSGFYYWAADLMSKMATELGKADDATKYGTLAKHISSAINATFFDAGAGSYGNSQFSNAFPLSLGFVPQGREHDVVNTLVSQVMVSGGGHFSGGLPGGKYIMDALEDYGRSDIVDLVVSRTDSPGWAYMLAQGPGSVWEDWHASSSLDHPMFTFIDTWLYNAVAGIQQAEPSRGYRQLIFDPQVTDTLASASGSLQTPFGPAAITWSAQASGVSYSLQVPVGSTATLRVPGSTADSVTESGAPAAERPGVKSIAQQGKDVLVVIGSGLYTFGTDRSLGNLKAAATLSAALSETVNAMGGSGAAKILQPAVVANKEAVTRALSSYIATGPDSAAPAVREAMGTMRDLSLSVASAGKTGLTSQQSESMQRQISDGAVALARVLDSSEVSLSIGTAESVVSPGSSTDVSVRIQNNGTEQLNASTVDLLLPNGWKAGKSTESAGAIAPAATKTVTFRITAPNDSPLGSVNAQVLGTFSTAGITLSQNASIAIRVADVISASAATVEPRVASEGGTALVQTELHNILTSHSAEVQLSLVHAPEGWTANDKTFQVPLGGNITASLALAARQGASSGPAQILVSDGSGRRITVLETTLLVRGQMGCSLDPTGEACLPADSQMVFNFETSAEGSFQGDGTVSVKSQTAATSEAWLGTGSLEIAPKPETTSQESTSATMTLKTPKPIDGAGYLTLGLRPIALAPGLVHEATVTVRDSGGLQVHTQANVAQDRWNVVDVSLTGSALRDVSSVEVSYRTLSPGILTPSSVAAGSMLVDGIILESDHSAKNLAAGQPVYASSSLNGNGLSLDNLVDGVRYGVAGNRGFSSDPHQTQPGQETWITVDMGQTQHPESVILYPQTAPYGEETVVSGDARLNDMQVELSQDNEIWQSVAYAADTQSLDGATHIRITSGSGRYLRLTRAGASAMAGSGLALSELEVYGSSDPVILEQPRPQDVAAGQDARFTVAARSAPGPQYQWQRSSDGGKTFIDLPGAIYSSLLLPSVLQFEDGDEVRVEVNNGRPGSTVVSQAAVLKVEYRFPKIEAEPADVYALSSSSDITPISARISGTAVVTQWQSSWNDGDWVSVDGALGQTLRLSPIDGSALPGERFRLVATNPLGEQAVSNPATFNLGSMPSVETPSANVAVKPGDRASIEISVAGAPVPAVQWSVQDEAGGHWKPLDGQGRTRLVIPADQVHNGASYRATATNQFGAATGPATVVSLLRPLATTAAPFVSPADAGPNVVSVALAAGERGTIWDPTGKSALSDVPSLAHDEKRWGLGSGLAGPYGTDPGSISMQEKAVSTAWATLAVIFLLAVGLSLARYFHRSAKQGRRTQRD